MSQHPLWKESRKGIDLGYTKNQTIKKLLFANASFSASIAVWLLSWLTPTGIFGVLTNNDTTNPTPKRRQKYKSVFSQPVSTKEYLTSKGETKYPKDPAQVTMPVAIVLLEAGKCFATTDTGIPIAVEPNPIPIITPIVRVK